MRLSTNKLFHCDFEDSGPGPGSQKAPHLGSENTCMAPRSSRATNHGGRSIHSWVPIHSVKVPGNFSTTAEVVEHRVLEWFC